MKSSFLLLNLLVALIVFSGASAAAQSLVGIGDLPGGPFESHAFGVSDDGEFVVGRSDPGGGVERAVTWTASGGLTVLPDGVGFASNSGIEVTPDRSVVFGLGTNGSGGFSIFRWVAGIGTTNLPFLNALEPASEPYAISSDGQIMIGKAGIFGLLSDALYWTPTGGTRYLKDVIETDFGIPLGATILDEATGMTPDGSIIVGGTRAGGAFIFDSSLPAYQELGFLPGGSFSISRAVSRDGTTVVGRAQNAIGRYVTFRWRAGTGMVPIPSLVTFASMDPIATSHDGSVMVGATSNQAFHWDEINGSRWLVDALADDYGIDTSGWSLNVPFAMTPDGRVIVGRGTNHNEGGRQEGFVATLWPAPEPGLSVGLWGGIAALACAERRRFRR